MTYIINEDAVRAKIREMGYTGVGDFSTKAGLHRNTLHYYLSGKPVIAKGLEQILSLLGLTLEEAILYRGSKGDVSLKPIALLLDMLQDSMPNSCLVLFGSRARAKHAKYSDFDVGAYSDAGLSHKDYHALLSLKEDFEEDSPFFIDLVNLNNADIDFLQRIANDWTFVGGQMQDWIALNEKVRNSI